MVPISTCLVHGFILALSSKGLGETALGRQVLAADTPFTLALVRFYVVQDNVERI